MEAVKPKCPPFLVIHGTADGCVPIEQADRFKAAMEHVGNRVDYHRMDEWKHAFIVPGYGEEEQIVEALRVSDAFLVKSGFQEVSP
jgi:dipeptidyl aminopeptidase/acylaminoacyl peptidase